MPRVRREREESRCISSVVDCTEFTFVWLVIRWRVSAGCLRMHITWIDWGVLNESLWTCVVCTAKIIKRNLPLSSWISITASKNGFLRGSRMIRLTLPWHRSDLCILMFENLITIPFRCIWNELWNIDSACFFFLILQKSFIKVMPFSVYKTVEFYGKSFNV